MEEVVWFGIALGAVCSLSTGFYLGYKCLVTNKIDQSDLNQLKALVSVANQIEQDKEQLQTRIQAMFNAIRSWEDQRVNANQFYQPGKVRVANQMNTHLSELYRAFCDQLNHYPSFDDVSSDDLEQSGFLLKQLEEHHSCVTASANTLIQELETYLNYLHSATEERPLLRP